MIAIVEWLESTWLSQFMNNYEWAFPTAETFHFYGLCILMGSIMFMDLRLLGFARNLSIKAVHQVLPWAWVGFGINVITGILFIFASASFYYDNTAFWTKMVFILIAGINALWFQFKIHPQINDWPDDFNPPASVKVVALISIVMWILVICFGRFIMYWPPW